MAIVGANGTYGEGILDPIEEIGVEAAVITRSLYKFQDVKPMTKVAWFRSKNETAFQYFLNLYTFPAGTRGFCDGISRAA